MITRSLRFKGHNGLRYLYSKGKSARSSSMTIRFAPNNHRSENRLAVVVSKKVSKSAVVRNRIRRRLYEQARPLLSAPGQAYDIAIIVYDARLAEAPATEITKNFTLTWRQAGLPYQGK